MAQNSELLISNGLKEPGPLLLAIAFCSGLLTSLGPCSLSLLPITVAYLAGFKGKQNPLQRSLIFSSGIVLSLVILGSLSGLFGQIYGQLSSKLNGLVSIIAIVMGLSLLGIIDIKLPINPNPNLLTEKLPEPLAPIAAGVVFGMASSPCTTPVLAVLLAWIAQNGNPVTGIILLAFFGAGQVIPLVLAGIAAGSIPNLLALKPFSRWIPIASGIIFLSTGSLSLISRWV
ncbi:cytochrome c biogenesis CcdA family protein [Prochlorococcus marinus]|uniref:cytochrome c biogenesis CcdA family protein n=1 Tax=Prochlorococcus marinus TaxID=1219 RepID=UPI003D2AC3A1